jgi:hypothetical protein
MSETTQSTVKGVEEDEFENFSTDDNHTPISPKAEHDEYADGGDVKTLDNHTPITPMDNHTPIAPLDNHTPIAPQKANGRNDAEKSDGE